MFGLHWLNDDFVSTTVDCIQIFLLDPKYGEWLDQPPHGHISAKAKQRLPGYMKILFDKVEGTGVGILGVKLGQGLIDQREFITDTVADQKLMEHSKHNIGVYLSHVTQHGAT
jgi:hypothetical protein